MKRLKNIFGNTKVRTLSYNLNLLKHELKTTSVGLISEKTNERKRINRQFTSKPKAVHRSFRNTNTTAKEIPTLEEVESYWSKIWGNQTVITAHRG